MSNTYDIFDKIIKEKGITAYRVAKDTGLTTVLFTDWKKGKSCPKINKLQVIAEYLGVSTDYLLGIETTKAEVLSMLPEAQLPEEFTDDEKEIISCYRKLSQDKKERFRSMLLSLVLED